MIKKMILRKKPLVSPLHITYIVVLKRINGMRTIAKLFGKSPFAPLGTHMKIVMKCMEKLSGIFQLLAEDHWDKLEEGAKTLSKLEHEADLTKNDIRNHLPKNIFMPIERGHFLEILSIQDGIADKAEDIAQLLTMRRLDKFDLFKADLFAFYEKNLEAFVSTEQIINEIDELLESSFGGIEAEHVKEMVDQTAFLEHEADIIQHAFLKKIFAHSDDMTPPIFYLWMRLIKEIACIADLSEKLANRIRMVLEIK